MHKRAVREKEFEDASKSGLQIKQKVIEQHIPKNSPLVAGFQRMDQAEEDTLAKLHDINYYIALRNHSFIEFKHLIELEEMHRMPYSSRKYINETGCRNIIQKISFCLFDSNIASKIRRVNFISILCDGSTDASVTELEVIYIVFFDFDALKLVLSFFEVAALDESQDPTGLKKVIIEAFKRNNLNSVLNIIAFLSSDRANVNCGKECGLIVLLQEERPWVVFIWCFFYR